jgi:hypothetical protein
MKIFGRVKLLLIGEVPGAMQVWGGAAMILLRVEE